MDARAGTVTSAPVTPSADRGVEEMGWEPARLLALPFYHSVEGVLRRLPAVGFPSLRDLNGVGAACQPQALEPQAVPPAIAFVPPGQPCSAMDYERRVYEDGEVVTREGSLHDLFNALVWMSFPNAKHALNELHVSEFAQQAGHARHALHGGRRGRLRDQATLFDESGMVVACADEELIGWLREFQWRRLFVQERRRVQCALRFFVFGHALLEKGLRPYKAMAGRILPLRVEPAFLTASLAEQRTHIDAAVAARVRSPLEWAARSALTPLPVLGIPGWCVDNEADDFYDDAQVFRHRSA